MGTELKTKRKMRKVLIDSDAWQPTSIMLDRNLLAAAKQSKAAALERPVDGEKIFLLVAFGRDVES